MKCEKHNWGYCCHSAVCKKCGETYKYWMKDDRLVDVMKDLKYDTGKEIKVHVADDGILEFQIQD